MQILSVTDNEFRKYGRIVDNIDFTALVEEWTTADASGQYDETLDCHYGAR